MNLEQAYYETRFENDFLRSKGNTFQELFERVMSLAHKSDFIACRPWGNQGDRKNDGFLKSSKCLFQVYAPNELTASEAIKKIREDFAGAKDHWGTLFTEWVFVHNADAGLPPHVINELLEFGRDNPTIKIGNWCLPELRDQFRRIEHDDLVGWFGQAPSAQTKARLGMADIQIILEGIQSSRGPDSPIVDVPPRKIEANALSSAVETCLRQGMQKAPLVQSFFEQWHDPFLGEHLAQSFRLKYAQLRSNFTPNTVFAELQAWVGGDSRGSPEHELAVLAVLAYYFERCDIFEAPRNQA